MPIDWNLWHITTQDQDAAPTYVGLREGQHKARKRHQCSTCGEPIEPGEVYRIEVAIWDGEFRAYRRHGDPKTCRLSRWKRSGYAGPPPAYLYDDENEA